MTDTASHEKRGAGRTSKKRSGRTKPSGRTCRGTAGGIWVEFPTGVAEALWGGDFQLIETLAPTSAKRENPIPNKMGDTESEIGGRGDRDRGSDEGFLDDRGRRWGSVQVGGGGGGDGGVARNSIVPPPPWDPLDGVDERRYIFCHY